MQKIIRKNLKIIVLLICILASSVPLYVFASGTSDKITTSVDEISAETFVEDAYALVSKQWEQQGFPVIYDAEYNLEAVSGKTTGTIVDKNNAYNL